MSSSTITVTMPSPVGRLILEGDGVALTRLTIGGGEAAVAPGGAFAEARRQLEEWFAGERTTFDLALDPRGTPFQHSVWSALREIPYGSTASYGEIAAAVGRPKAARAVGAANGANPICIVVPCHRVIGASGSLTGYRWGLEPKRLLLEHEANTLSRSGLLRAGA